MKTSLQFQPFHLDNTSPFTLGPRQRQLRVFVDSLHLTPGLPALLLDEFAGHDEVEVVRTSVAGESRIVYGDRVDDLLKAEVKLEAGAIRTGIMFVSQWEHFARKPLLRDDEALPPGPWDDESYRRDRYFTARIAHSVRADVLVSDDPFLLIFTQPDLLALNVVSSADGAGLLGLYLRNRNDYTYLRSRLQGGGSFAAKSNRSLYYWQLCRFILSSGWRWFSSIMTSDGSTGNQVTTLAQAVFTRFAQALRARDHALWTLLKRQDESFTDDLLFYLDMMLLSLSACFDVVAHVADISLGLSTPLHQVYWNSAGWRRELRRIDRSLDDAMAPVSESGLAYRLLTLLRNSIHGQALDTLTIESDSKPLRHGLKLPRNGHEELRFLLDRVGGLEAWGYEDLQGVLSYIDPGVLPELLLPRIARALNELMTLTPVERLPGLGGSPSLMSSPPSDDLWKQSTLERLWQLSGLSMPS